MNVSDEAVSSLAIEPSQNGDQMESPGTPAIAAAFLLFARHDLLAPVLAARHLLADILADQEHLPPEFAGLLSDLTAACDRSVEIIEKHCSDADDNATGINTSLKFLRHDLNNLM